MRLQPADNRENAPRAGAGVPLIDCRAYVYLWKDHPLADEKSIGLEQLADYPCLVFEQGDGASGFLAEEILTDNDYPRIIRSTDRATQLNLMVGLNGYTLCSGIICEELNGNEYRAVPFREDENNRNTVMEIGYVMKKHSILSDIGEVYISEVRRYLSGCEGEHFPDHVHFHDGCGGQYFSLDEENDALCGFIAGYFAERGLTAEFTSGGTVFTVSKN